MRAVRITQFGGPEVLELTDVDEPVPVAGQLVVPVLSSGVNYADTHATEDSYLAKQQLPLVPGGEVVVRMPDGRRALALVGSGGYAERVAVDPRMTFAIPDGVGDAAALCCLVQGASAWHLLRTSTRMQPGESVVVHAAAGGVGSIAVQLAKLWGAGRVIATASTAEKRDLAVSLGADVAIDSTADNLTAALRTGNNGQSIDVILEMTGGQVFTDSLSALAPFGRLAVYGMAGRVEPEPIRVTSLMAHSRAVAGFWLAHLTHRPAELAATVTELLDLVAAGTVRPVIGGSYPLDRVADAHRALLSRTSVGKLIVEVN
jgi:NADPH2:quinone reductase